MRQILSTLGLKHPISPGIVTEHQPVFMILSTDKENNCARFIKLTVIPVDNKEFLNKFFSYEGKGIT